ncbi:MAG: thiolase family protein [Lautropia mirabilis]
MQPPLSVPLLAGCRTPVAPRHGALRHHTPHTLAAPLVQHLLKTVGLPSEAVDTLILGNALGAGGNPARMTALAAGLPQHCATFSVDTQCCSGLDAINLAAARILSGQSDVVIAGGAEAWTRSPIRQHRPMDATQATTPYERPAFTPWPERDPDPLQAAADYAARHGFTRHQQDEYARDSHARAVRARAARPDCTPSAILPLEGLLHDAYPRLLTERQASRMPVAARTPTDTQNPAASAPEFALSRLAISPQADGAALVLMASAEFCTRHSITPASHWLGGLSLGTDPENPLAGALAAAETLLQRHRLSPDALHAVELHDAFAVQGLAFQQALQSQGLDPARLNTWGGGLARGHPIGASGAIALVELLARLHATGAPCATSALPEKPESSGIPTAPSAAPHPVRPDMPGTETTIMPHHSLLGLACIAGMGGLGSAALVAAHR